MPEILKKEKVKMAGSCRVDLTGNVIHRGAESETDLSKPKAQVRIVETCASSMLLEFTCPCGTKTYIQCDYE
jgi:hypothetical protein